MYGAPLLLALCTPRGEAEAGRYQSHALSLSEVKGFLAKFGAFLSGDARFDIWAHSASDEGTVVWDRHDILFAYGAIEQFSATLRSLGFSEGSPSVPVPHEHHYRAELDQFAEEIMSSFNWSYSPLRPEDEQ